MMKDNKALGSYTLGIIEKYYSCITIVVLVILFLFFPNFSFLKLITTIIVDRNDLLMTISSILVGTYFNLIILFTNYPKGSFLYRLKDSSFKYLLKQLLFGLTCNLLFIFISIFIIFDSVNFYIEKILIVLFFVIIINLLILSILTMIWVYSDVMKNRMGNKKG